MTPEIAQIKSQVSANTAQLTYSVLVCTFKRPVMLGDLLGSLYRQNWLPGDGRLELVVVDNNQDSPVDVDNEDDDVRDDDVVMVLHPC